MQSGRGTFWASEFLLSLLSMVYLIYGLSVSMCVRLSLGWAVVNTVVR